LVEIHAAGLGLVLVALVAAGRQSIARGNPPGRSLPFFVAAGVACGLAVGAKMTAVGFALGCGALLLLDLAAKTRRAARRGWGATLLAGLALLLVSVSVFVGTNPYLHPDPWNRLLEIRNVWERIIAARTANPAAWYASAYPPGVRSLTEAGSALVMPESRAAWLLLVPFAAALCTWLPAGHRLPDASIRPLLWLLALPALVTAAFLSGGLVHVWIVWAALVAGLLRFAARGSLAESSSELRAVGVPLLMASLGALAVIHRTIHISWARYYIPLIPLAVLIAARELDELQRWASGRGGRIAGALVRAAVLLGIASSLAAYPNHRLAGMTRDGEVTWASPTAVLSAFSMGSIGAAVLLGWLRRGPRLSPRCSPDS
jgi:hypothetical protein